MTGTPSPSRPLLVGVAVGDVTPPAGIDVAGFCLRLTTRGVHRSLRAGVATFSDGERTACLVTCDLLGFTVPYATALRSEIAARLGIAADGVLLAASHTHSAPALSLELKIGGRQDEWTPLEETYERFWRAKVLALCQEALRSAVPARLAASRDGSAAIGLNRRVRLPDGRMIIGRTKDRPADHSVGVVRVDRLDGGPLLAILNYACHPISLGPEAEVVSPDYPGAARETLEAVTGAPALFVQGAGGDIAPADGMGPDPSIADLLGRTLGLEAAKVWSTIETRNLERREEIVQSYNPIAGLVKIEHPLPDARVRYAAETLALPLETPPTPEEAEAIARRADERLVTLVAEDAPEGALNIGRIETRWGRMLRRRAAEGTLGDATAIGVVQVVRVNDVVFVALPVEPFVLIGHGIIGAIDPERTIICGYANGTIGYCPMPEDYPEGGYEVERAHHLYGQPAALAPTVAPFLVDEATRLAAALA
ncbi:MAG: hypothetical protein A2X23_09130 [Chloroflexi bacterium GWC2_73_18]|nr:MAG: hypothetical protein A2X23_09130 [Chloroflexi bacterium GWC2_73_18]